MPQLLFIENDSKCCKANDFWLPPLFGPFCSELLIPPTDLLCVYLLIRFIILSHFFLSLTSRRGSRLTLPCRVNAKNIDYLSDVWMGMDGYQPEEEPAACC